MGVSGQLHAPAHLLLGKARYMLYRRLGLTGCRKSRPKLAFDPRTVHPVASLYSGRQVQLVCLLSAVGYIQSFTFIINRIFFRFT